MTWQPIETAPKDGTLVLLWLKRPIYRQYPSSGLCDLFCIGLHQYGRWVSMDVEDCGSMGGELTGWMPDYSHLDVEPTHWMPLPEPPAQAGEAGTAETTKIGSVYEHAVVADDAPKGESS